MAATFAEAEIIDMLIQEGADLELCDEYVLSCPSFIVQVLKYNSDGRTPLHELFEVSPSWISTDENQLKRAMNSYRILARQSITISEFSALVFICFVTHQYPTLAKLDEASIEKLWSVVSEWGQFMAQVQVDIVGLDYTLIRLAANNYLENLFL